MKKLIALSMLVALTGCATYVPSGAFYTGGKMGLQDNGGSTPKVGKACMHSVMGGVAWGDGSIAAAKANGGITKTSTVDYKVKNILGVYGCYCTVVRGE